MNTNLPRTLLLSTGALLATMSGSFAAGTADPVEQATPAIYRTQPGTDAAVRPAQYVYTPWGSTWYGANSYAYAPASSYVTPLYDYYGYGPGYPSSSGVAYRTSFYAPTVSSYTSYRPYYVSHGPAGYSYGWLPYSYQTHPAGSFYRYYGPVYGSGFHMWFGY